MRVTMAMGALAVLAAGACSGMAGAGVIERACLKSDRGAASRSMCGCIQQVADLTLTRRDQRLAASFFGDPHQAQVIRQSDRAAHEVFWKKYKAFGANAQNYCS